jgi:hypothetical protein
LEGLSLQALEERIMQQATGESPQASAETALRDLIERGGGPVDFEEYYRSSIRDPLVQEFQERILPELTRRYGSSGAFGSDRMTAEQQAAERLTKTLAGARGELAFRTQESAADRLLKAIGAAPGLEGGGADTLLKLMQGAALPRQLQQARLTAEYGEFQRQQAQKSQRIQQILTALGVKTKENIPQNIPGTKGIFTEVLGMGGGGGFF